MMGNWRIWSQEGLAYGLTLSKLFITALRSLEKWVGIFGYLPYSTFL